LFSAVHGAAQELQLEARLAFEIEDALALVVDVEDRFPCVVFDQHFVFCRCDVKAELSNAGFRCREARTDGAFGLIRAQGDFLYPDQISAVLDQQFNGLVIETPMGDDDIGDDG
jgi:hypothetical protein